ncbi:MAG: HAD-IIIC family phosphatase [Pseudolabrys sp.]
MSTGGADLLPLTERCAAARSLQQLTACVRDYAAAGMPRSPTWPKIRLAITGNYSTQFLAQGFPLALAARELAADVYESPYNQWRAELLDGGSSLHAFAPTHVLLALTSIELGYGTLRSADAVVKAVSAAVEAALKTGDAHVLVTLPEPLADEVSDNSAAYAWRHEIGKGLRLALASPRVTLIDIEPLMRSVGAQMWFDDRFYDVAKLPFHPDRTPAVLGVLADAVVGAIAPRCKLVVVDLDDTLWGGRVGDDGYDGVNLDPAGTGRHFLRLQAFLAGLHAKGVVLSIASKNNPAAVKEVFAKRGEMLLRFEDFAAAEIHWEPKSSSVARILERLKLSTAGVVFLDDNPVERAEVRRRFPEIAVPGLPDDPAQRVPMLARTGLFDHRLGTIESLDRNRMYAENAVREDALRDAGDYQEFLGGLQMVMEGSALEEARERVIELIHKTNQFNLTTRRYNWADLSAVLHTGFGRCYRLKDKFGDNGIISVVAVARDSEDDARIDLWLMSCRVLGRKVEEAILADIVARARASGARRLLGEYSPTAKNDLVRELYPRLGFRQIGNNGPSVIYELPIDDVPYVAAPDFIKQSEPSSTVATAAN